MLRCLTVSFLLAALAGCETDLGEIPFFCNPPPGKPACPDGYECKGIHCVRVGECPEKVPACHPPPNCGDGSCGADETNATCPADCPLESCGNEACDTEESTATCPADCPAGKCGNGKCEPEETPTTCAADCPAGKCGNQTCDAGETSATCPADCPTPQCGNNKCEAEETAATCPADCSATCTGSATQCDGASSLRACEGGIWKTKDCASLCVSGGYSYSTGCEYSPTSSKYICACGNYVPFGGLCDAKKQCDTSGFCAVLGADPKGYCSKYCTTLNATCSGAPTGTTARCVLPAGGKYACGFTCNVLSPKCPTGLSCDPVAELCKI